MQANTPTLNTHLFTRLLTASLAIAAGLLTLVWLLQSLRFLDLMINKGLTLATFLNLTLLLVPFLLTIITPLALLGGTLYTFKNLSDNNELTALFGAGLPRGHILKPALWLAVAAMVLSYVNAFYLTPTSMANFKSLQNELRHSEGHLLLEAGTFNPLGDDIMVYLKSRTGKTGLSQLLVHDSRNKNATVTWMAKSGQITFSPDGYPQLKLKEGIRQKVGKTQTSMLAFKSHTLDIQRQIAKTPTRVKNAEERLLSELTTYQNPKQKQEFEAEIMSRLLFPLTPLVLTLLAGAFLVVPRAGRRGVLRPMTYASVLGVLYIIALISLNSLAQGGNTLVLYGQCALPLLTILMTLFFLKERTHG